MDKHLYDRGLARCRQVLGDANVDRALANVDDFNRDCQGLATEYCWDEVWADETLAPRERSISPPVWSLRSARAASAQLRPNDCEASTTNWIPQSCHDDTATSLNSSARLYGG